MRTRIERAKRIISRSPSHRTGAAMIEFAIFLPIFVTIMMATVETCRVIYLRQSIKIAAYECARLGIVPGVTGDALQNQCDVILLGRGLKDFELVCTPSDLATLEYGNTLTTTVSIQVGSNALSGSWYYRDKVLSEMVTIMAEY